MNEPMKAGPISFAAHIVQDSATGQHFGCAIFTQLLEDETKQVQFHADGLQLINMAETLLALAEKLRLAIEPIPASGKGH